MTGNMTIKELKNELCLSVISYFKDYDPATWTIYSTVTINLNDEDLITHTVFISLRKGFDQMCKVAIEAKSIDALHNLIKTKLDDNGKQIDITI